MKIEDLKKAGGNVNEEVYECPKCGEYELRPERMGHRDEDFAKWDKTGTWICDNADCGAEYWDSDGELILQ